MQQIIVPAMGESITEGTISKWIVKVGDSVKQGDVLLELETDKVNIEISAEQDGTIQEITRSEGDTVQIGEAIGSIAAGGAAPSAPAAEPAKAAPAVEAAAPAQAAPIASPVAEADSKGGQVAASPAARKLAREKGIDLTQVQSRDPLSRVSSDDVRSHGTQPAAPQAPLLLPLKRQLRLNSNRLSLTSAKNVASPRNDCKSSG